MNKHEFYLLAREQGQRRFPKETFDEFYQRVVDVKKAREKHCPPWRRDSGEHV